MELPYSTISKQLGRANGILSKLRHNAHICVHVYYAIFYSHLIYGCTLYIWGLTTDENLNNISKSEKCLRIMTFSDFYSHTNTLFIDLKLLKVRDSMTALLMWYYLTLPYLAIKSQSVKICV